MVFARTAFRTLRSLPPTQLAQATSRISNLRLLSTEARKTIDDAVKANPLVVFMKGTPDQPQCGFSRAVCQILDVQGVPRESLKSYNCLEDQELREGIKEYSEWPTIPQVYIKGEFVGGCDIVLSMHQSGELEKLLVKEGLIPELPTLPEDK
ncbi:thioredoxin-like protein [Dioszegia hungarica]|uniref:Monothiol glutaredoxin-5, mitochondrial n=1 Tax=Dioszegia hungarica TaxID=4972 RepID=A0AA38LXX1_9TREE|nr:thioredoxin-like protein [Dioszegia hungarica]KAI9637966.1 thioredoxin-like protein [Dioszegia hungarica]